MLVQHVLCSVQPQTGCPAQGPTSAWLVSRSSARLGVRASGGPGDVSEELGFLRDTNSASAQSFSTLFSVAVHNINHFRLNSVHIIF